MKGRRKERKSLARSLPRAVLQADGSDSTRRKKWDRWLAELRREVGHALLAQEIFWQLQALAKQHPNSISPSALFDWMCWNHIEISALRVRRFLDQDRRSRSLIRLLREMYERPSAINQAFHASLYERTPFGVAYGAKCFEQSAKTKSGRLSLIQLRSQISNLGRISDRIRYVVDKRIAHTDERFSKRVRPTLNELTTAFAEIDRLVCHYSFLLTGSHWDTCKPERQEDWRPRLLQQL